ncbi:hypothetical protein DRP07_06245 [Archaeoglobales archaeon]|nr:MAG: hypothetical protein DRP07_06245 [Archaeoglobales archaeon]
MGRSVASIRQEVKRIAERWGKTKRALRKEDQLYAEKLAEMTKRHSNEVFYLFDDALEAAVFSVLIEIMKEIDEIKANQDVDS